MAKRVVYGLLFAVALMGIYLWIRLRDPVGVALSLIVFALFATLVVAIFGYVISNAPHWVRRFRGISWAEHVDRLEASGQAEREYYRTNRALSIDDYRTGCIAHLIDVGEDRVLCLYGQNHYEFEPNDDDPEINQPRRFPTSEFSLSRHRKSGDVLRLIPGDDVIEPITVFR